MKLIPKSGKNFQRIINFWWVYIKSCLN